jgi:ankyrin repeat protein
MSVGKFELTRNGSEIYFICIVFQTPLHNAAGNGEGDVVEILLQNGANINEKFVRFNFLRNRYPYTT